jgi:hypothetical protein
MARLHNKPFPGKWDKKPGESYQEYSNRTSALEAAIPWDRVMSFPVADGKACYFVKSEKPLVLQHIPLGDAYQIPDAHLRGLRPADWKKQKQFHKLFSGKK